MKQENKERLKGLIIGILFGLLLIWLSGCTSKFVWTDDVVGFSGSLCSWGKVDDLQVNVNDTQIQAGGVEYRPDANSVEAVAGSVTGALMGGI